MALGGSNSSFNVGSLSTSGALTGFHAGAYTSFTLGQSYIELDETFSAFANKTTRNAGGFGFLSYEKLTANFSSREFRTRAEFGHSVELAGLRVTPFAAVDVAAYSSDAFKEFSWIPVSALAITNNGQLTTSLPTFLGLRLSNGWRLDNGWNIAPTGSVAWVHEFFPERQFTNALTSLPGPDFTVSGPRSAYNLVQAKIGLQVGLQNQIALFSDFQGEFSNMSRSYGGKAGVRYYW